ncbi:hypothetical protein G9C85_00155 [Halorubellus sp. JP-L1]|uniref:hypothetical protein n=1 Tax=Halorubellus sp. JP-L1 TaxID=2715753 RepID=UPI001408D0EA|nr:hypothetical protein [Halorubellus sp. JP-L1]NHN40050.1 hypothetical protein [Halorubellus sp. JP-L1]
MTNRTFIALGVLMLVASATIAVVAVDGAGAGAGASTTSNDTADYSLEELRQGGVKPAGAPDSARQFSWGFVSVRHSEPNPMVPGWKYLESGSTVKTDELTVYSGRFGDVDDMDAELVVVYYDTERVTVQDGNTTRRETVVANQTTERKEIDLQSGYATTNVSLQSHYDDSKEVTMWLENGDGDPLEGARWTFTHRSIPTTQSIGFSTWGGLSMFLFWNVIGPGILGTLAGFKQGHSMLKQAGRGPGLGLGGWGFIAIVGIIGVAWTAWYDLAVVLTTLPIISGLTIAAVAFVAYLEVGGGETKRALFRRDELGDAQSPTGEDAKHVTYTETDRLEFVETDDGDLMPVKPGILPFIARWRGTAPTLSVDELQTRLENQGDASDVEFVADPLEDEAVHYTAPSLGFDLALSSELDDDELESLEDRPEWAKSAARINWGRIASLVALPTVAFYATRAYFGLFSAASLAALATFLVLAIRVDTGSVNFEPAPYHQLNARAAVAEGRTTYDDAKTIEALEEIAWREQSTTALEARALASRRDKTVTERMNEGDLGLEDDTSTDVDEQSDRAREDERERQRRRQSPDPDDEDLVVADD